jgi:ribosomal protein S18 acetylase RimI-like enzyme
VREGNEAALLRGGRTVASEGPIMVGMRARASSAAEIAEAIFAAEDDLLAFGCRRERLSFGEALVDAAHPSIYDVNSLRAVVGTPTWPVLESGFSLVQRGCGCRHKRVVARDPETIRHLDGLLLPRSFQRQVCVAMALERPAPARPVPPGMTLHLVDEGDAAMLEAVSRCQDRVRRDEAWYSPDVSVQMDEMAERQLREGGAHFLAAVNAHGIVAGALLLYCRDSVGFIADVGTAPSFRRSGIATALVAAASSLAQGRGCSVVGLTARRDDDPRHLYARVGFEVIGESVDWLRGA